MLPMPNGGIRMNAAATIHVDLASSSLPRRPLNLELVERAAALQPLLRRNAPSCESARRIVDENIAALEEARLFDVIVPKRLGRHGESMATMLAVAAELAKGCASTAWVQTLINVTTWSAALLPSAAQGEIFGGPTPARVCGVLAPTGTATPVVGGYRVSGKWGFASGCLHANWATGGVMFLDERGEAVDQGSAYMPIADLEIEDTWHVAGMRGTGSNTLVAKDVFVPRARAVSAATFVAKQAVKSESAEPSDRWPLGSVLALVLVGPTLGMAEAVLESVSAGTAKRGISYTSYGRQAESHVVLHDLAKAALDVETAKMHAMRSAAEIDDAGRGAAMSFVAQARLRAACGYAVQALRAAVDALVSIAGASSFAEASPVQRYWRDLNMASRHAFVATAPCLETYGRALAGVESIFVFV
jgi:3-hydroxy-9,10-secoandrosta-1,3,5(10)-triene-9,17-dione monooxygenase